MRTISAMGWFAALALSSTLTASLAANYGSATSHVRLQHPDATPPPIPVTDVEGDSGGMTAFGLAPGQSCDAIPFKHHNRWPVKTSVAPPLTDQATLDGARSHTLLVSDVFRTPNLGQLDGFDAKLDRSDTVTLGGRRHHEGDAIAVRGYVVGIGCESDSDLHVNIAADPKATTCFVVEVPNPNDLQPGIPKGVADEVRAMTTPVRRRFGEMYADGFSKSRPKPGQTFPVLVVGQLFYDNDHWKDVASKGPGGGRGVTIGGATCARTLWEIHPVLDLIEP